MAESPSLMDAQELVKQQHFDAAVPMLLDIIKTQPASNHVHYTLGYAYFYLGDLTASLGEFIKALEIDSTDSATLYFLGVISERIDRPNDARLYFAAALQANPDYEPAAKKLGVKIQTANQGIRNSTDAASIPHALPRTPDSAETAAGEGSRIQNATNNVQREIPQLSPLPEPTSENEVGPEGMSSTSSFFQLLQSDPAPISQRIVNLIRKLEIDVQPRMAPYIVPVIVKFFVAFVLAAMLFTAESALYPGMPAMTTTTIQDATSAKSVAEQKEAAIEEAANQRAMTAYENRRQSDMNKLHNWEFLVFGLLTLAFLAVLGVEAWRVSRMRYIFCAGRIIVEHGIIRKRESFELVRVVETSVRQTFLSMLTGDGVMTVSYEIAGKNKALKLLGLAKFAQLTQTQDNLREVVIELRSTNWGKGIVY